MRHVGLSVDLGRLQSHNVRRRKRTEEQMANAAAETQAHVAASGGLQAQGLAGLGQLPMQQGHGLLGGQPNLSDLLQQVGVSGMDSLLSSALAGAAHDPSRQGKLGECICCGVMSWE